MRRRRIIRLGRPILVGDEDGGEKEREGDTSSFRCSECSSSLCCFDHRCFICRELQLRVWSKTAMALSKKGLILVLVSTLLCGLSLGAVHNVGDSAGWTSMGKIDYGKWAASQKFMVGDTIVFNYNKQFHNVMQVTLPEYRSCNASSPIATYTSGSDSITIKKPGHLFFLCGVPGHCEAGQKVDIRVLGSNSLSPNSSPSTVPIGSPKASSLPSLAPASAPAAQSDAPLLNISKLWLALGLPLAALLSFAY